MNFNLNGEFTLLTADQVFGPNKSELIRDMGSKCALTDFAIILGANGYDWSHVDYDKSLKGRAGWYYLSSTNIKGAVDSVNETGSHDNVFTDFDTGGIRPVFKFSDDINILMNNGVTGKNGFLEIEYGEYPQYAVSESMEHELEKALFCGQLQETGRKYTGNFRKNNKNSSPFNNGVEEYRECEYDGRKYITTCYIGEYERELSNGKKYKNGNQVWIEVSPLKWYIDSNAKIMLCKNLIASGIRFCNDCNYYGDFKKTAMYDFLNNNFAKDIVQISPKEKKTFEEKQQIKGRRNPYGLNLDQVSEEEIIKGAIESGVAVFLHGASSEGKSARVKQIDPDSVIIYLRNATPESLNGKSVYNQQTGEMFDIKPTWLKKLETKCEAEPDKLHIVFFDEITNALPSIQGIAFNIVLDREVNGMWQLPKNARIVAAGNEMKDSLSANQLAEPLFNRFAHVYIKTTTEGWLKWARENNIHPAIYSYIAYKNGETLRSEYNGETPNADPRKWEMASKMLYATGKPAMLRSLVGEDITEEFVGFCDQPVITLDDVINDCYSETDIELLNTAQRYATTMGLSQVDEENMTKVRNFVTTNLGAEFEALFDQLWASDDEYKLELIAEARLANSGEIKRWVLKK